MYVLLITAGGRVMRALGDPDVFAGWRWTPAPHMQISLTALDLETAVSPAYVTGYGAVLHWAGFPLVTIDATDGPYGGPEYPTGGPQ